MSANFNKNLRLAIGFCQQGLDLAAKGMAECNDDSCSSLWSNLQNSMQQCLNLIEKEIEGHKSKNKWD